MKKVLILLLSLLVCCTARAVEYTHLTFENADGLTQSIAVESLEFTFTDGKLMAANGVSTLSISLADLAKMYFSGEQSGSEDIEIFAGKEIEVYSLAGVKIGSYKSAVKAVEYLPVGVYLFKSNGVIQKVSVK